MQKDNGNIDFSYNCLKWMIGDEKASGPGSCSSRTGPSTPASTCRSRTMPDELADRLLDFS